MQRILVPIAAIAAITLGCTVPAHQSRYTPSTADASPKLSNWELKQRLKDVKFPPKPSDAQIRTAFQQAAKEELKDPNVSDFEISAVYKCYRISSVKNDGKTPAKGDVDGLWCAIVKFNARNGFGAFTGITPWGMVLISLSNGRFYGVLSEAKIHLRLVASYDIVMSELDKSPEAIVQ